MDTFDTFNTRRYPRTLDEAFPSGPAYGCAVTRPESRGEKLADKLAGVALAIVIGVCLAGALVQWWSS